MTYIEEKYKFIDCIDNIDNKNKSNCLSMKFKIEPEKNNKLDHFLEKFKKNNDQVKEEEKKYWIDVKNLIIYTKFKELNSKLSNEPEFIDFFENFNEKLHAKITHTSTKIKKFSTLLSLKINKAKNYEYLNNINFFKEFTTDIFLSNIYDIFNYSLIKGKDEYSINKNQLIYQMNFFPKYNNKNSDISDYIKSLNDIDYMIVSLFFYIKSNLILSFKKIAKDNPSQKEDIKDYIYELINSLHDIYLYLNCIKEEIIILNNFIKNKFNEISNFEKNKIKIKFKDGENNLLMPFINFIFDKIDNYFRRCLNY